MSNIDKFKKRIKRKKGIRARVSGTSDRPRLSVFRSSDHIYAQLIDDSKGLTLVSADDLQIITEDKTKKDTETKKNSTRGKDLAFKVGNLLASKAAQKKIKRIVFDRGGYKYHGRVSALADGARKGGLEF